MVIRRSYVAVATSGLEDGELTAPWQAVTDAGSRRRCSPPPDDLGAFTGKLVEEIGDGQHDGPTA
ncbi:MAG: hypothetical protein BGN98_09670 [Microbacterium sp. 69-7]|uniref:hypothetical protein n=1 Tax=Microbacterium sp. 69-7 TaxID=1895784 RepID=UPI0009597E29|nr:hypothetical protein [Microbacterium sp. 69-7]OJU45706.1 MAG: hypothetical protein BGN98_09670 [Microbacterium sp. 69-7]